MANETEEFLIELKALRAEIAEQYKVKEMGVFGSVVRGEESKGSDVDILVEFEGNADLFDLVGLGLFLEEKLQRKVDVVPKSALRPEIRERVLSEVVTL